MKIKFNGKQIEITKQIAIRSVGVMMFAFPAGAATAGFARISPLIGGLLAFGTSMIVVITFLGVLLAWNGEWSVADVQEAFRTAASKASDNDTDIKNVIEKEKK